jgi:hypothetical protein
MPTQGQQQAHMHPIRAHCSAVRVMVMVMAMLMVMVMVMMIMIMVIMVTMCRVMTKGGFSYIIRG